MSDEPICHDNRSYRQKCIDLRRQLEEANKQKSDWHSMYQEAYDEAEALRAKMFELVEQTVADKVRWIAKAAEYKVERDVLLQAVEASENEKKQYRREADKYREALERITYADFPFNEHEGFNLRKIAREALG